MTTLFAQQASHDTVAWWITGSLLVLGACIGSFLNVVVYRVPAGLSLVSPPSRCPKCETPIRWYDNIPILSWILLRGRCRDCSVWIPMRYPLVELLTALVFARIAWMSNGFIDGRELELIDSLALWLRQSHWPLVVALVAASCLVVVACWSWDSVQATPGYLAIVLVTAITAIMSSPDAWQRALSVGLGSIAGLAVGWHDLTHHSLAERTGAKMLTRLRHNASAIGVLAGVLLAPRHLLGVLVGTTVAALLLVVIPWKPGRGPDLRFSRTWVVFGAFSTGALATPLLPQRSISPRWSLVALAIIVAGSLLTQVVLPRQSLDQSP